MDKSFWLTIGQNMKSFTRNSDLNIFKKRAKNGGGGGVGRINFRPYHRDISTWNCYLLKH